MQVCWRRCGESLAENTPLVWGRVNNLPDYVYFNHSIHIAKGVGCSSCHGPVDQMPLSYKAKSLTMEFCLDCHRDPGPQLRPESEIYNTEWHRTADTPPAAALLAHYKVPDRDADGLLDMSPVTGQPRQWRGRLEDAALMAREFPALAGALARPGIAPARASPDGREHGTRRACRCDPSAPDGNYVSAVNQAPDIVPGLAEPIRDGAVWTAAPRPGLSWSSKWAVPSRSRAIPPIPRAWVRPASMARRVLLDFYDPDRSSGLLHGGEVAPWQALSRRDVCDSATAWRRRGAPASAS